MKHEMPSCFGRVGIGAGEADAPFGFLGHRRPHLLAVEHPSAFDARRTRRQRGEVGARARFAEQLAPADLAAQRRQDPPLLLLGRAVARSGSAAPTRRRRCSARDDLRGAELLLDHEQLERAWRRDPTARPAGRDVAVVGEPVALLRAASPSISARNARQLRAMRLALRRARSTARRRRAPPCTRPRRARRATRRACRRSGATSSRAGGRCARRAPT